jgi:hypothetical protein
MNKGSKKWELVEIDNPDMEVAGKMARFIDSFSDYDQNRKNLSAEYFLWNIVRNLHGQGHISLAVDGEKIVGTTTITRKKVWFRGSLGDSGR